MYSYRSRGYYDNTTQNYNTLPVYSPEGITVKKKIDLAATRWNSLRRIIYPPGACKEFEYKTYMGYGNNLHEGYVLAHAGGLRIKSITDKTSVTTSTGQVTSYEYFKEDGTSSGQRYGQMMIGGWVTLETDGLIDYLVPEAGRLIA